MRWGRGEQQRAAVLSPRLNWVSGSRPSSKKLGAQEPFPPAWPATKGAAAVIPCTLGVRKSHCHVYLEGLIQAKPPLKPFCDAKTNLSIFITLLELLVHLLKVTRAITLFALNATSERKSRTHSYDELVDLLIELALERENDSHMEKFLKKHLGPGGTPTPERGEGKAPKNPTNANQGGGKGRGNLRAMNEVKPDAGTPPLFYCKRVNDKRGPCHAPDCNHRSSCMLQMK